MPESPGRTRPTVAAVVLGLIGLTALPYVRHDIEAAGFAREVVDRFQEAEEFEVFNVESGVTSTPGSGSHCHLTATVSFTSPLKTDEAEARIKELLREPSDLYFWPSLTPKASKAGWTVFEFTVGTLGEGGSWDLRCG